MKFDEHLRAALVTNVQAPLCLLQLAKEMKGLDVSIRTYNIFRLALQVRLCGSENKHLQFDVVPQSVPKSTARSCSGT